MHYDERLVDQGRQVGRELYPVLDDDDKVIIAFGMTPLPIIQSVERNTRRRLAKIEIDRLQVADPDLPVWENAVDKVAVQSVVHGAVLGLMEAATAAGKMRV